MSFRQVIRIAVLSALLSAGGLYTTAASAQSHAEHTPGYQHHAAGSQAYRAGQYQSAKASFKRAAHWADKLAQFNLGIMNYHGQGVEADKARAWAWFQLSAERGYRQMRDMVEVVSRELDESEMQRARTILEEQLLPQYGDAVAMERAARRMNHQRRRMTGSRTGFIGNLTVVDRSGRTRDGEDFYRPEAWDFYQVIATEADLWDALDRGNVTLRELVIPEDDE